MALSSTSTPLLVTSLLALVAITMGGTCSYTKLNITVLATHPVTVDGTKYQYEILCNVRLGACLGGCASTIKSSPFLVPNTDSIDSHCDYNIKGCIPESTKSDLVLLKNCRFLPDDDQPSGHPDLPEGTQAPTGLRKSYTVAKSCACSSAYKGTNKDKCEKLQ